MTGEIQIHDGLPAEMIIDHATKETSHIHSDWVSYPSRNGKKIAAYVDRRGHGVDKSHFVVMSPKYGETKKNNLQLAYYLVSNGLNVLRFDHANHVGESEGDQTAFTLPGGVDDILGSIDFLEREYGASKITLLASSLSARTAIRAAALDSRVVHLVCLVGVVNVQHTLKEVYQEDLVGNHLSGKRWGITDILGVEIDFDKFLSAAVASNMHDLAGTQTDLLRIGARVSFFPAEHDVWVTLADVKAISRNLGTVKVYPIPEAMHEVRENPKAAEKVFNDMVLACAEDVGRRLPANQVISPDKKQVFTQNKIERERMKQANPVSEPERDFWSKYLGKYQMLEKVDDYRSYLETVGQMLGPVGESEIVLDAGCGNGLFGVWTLRDILARTKASWNIPPVYIGMDLTRDGLCDALERHANLARRMFRANATGKVLPGLLYTQADLDIWSGAPEGGELVTFEDHCFDKVCCSLVLSYLKHPKQLLQELYRVLKPGGRLVISSMKPFCDMSVIYRDFMDQTISGEDLESARNLLRAAGAIKLKEEQGYYTFYSGEELLEAVKLAGFRNAGWDNCFGNQAVAVFAEK